MSISAVKRLITINHIQNKSFCLHNICVCTVSIIMYMQIHTHAIYILKIFYKDLHVYISIVIIYIIYTYIKYINITSFS